MMSLAKHVSRPRTRVFLLSKSAIAAVVALDAAPVAADVSSLCSDDSDKNIVAGSTAYILHAIVFCVATGLLACFGARWLGMSWWSRRRVDLSGNRSQVVLLITVGATIRFVTFIPGISCALVEFLRVLKDSTLFAAFVLIVLFWIELQGEMRRQKSVSRLRPHLIATMCLFAGFRLGKSLCDLYWTSVAADCMAVGYTLMYAVVMVLGLVFGVRLLRRMRTTASWVLRARLMKLTIFILLEVVVLVLFFVSWALRSTVFVSYRSTDPWSWFIAKLPEKAFEILAVFVLLLTMISGKAEDGSGGGGGGSNNEAGEARLVPEELRSALRYAAVPGVAGRASTAQHPVSNVDHTGGAEPEVAQVESLSGSSGTPSTVAWGSVDSSQPSVSGSAGWLHDGAHALAIKSAVAVDGHAAEQTAASDHAEIMVHEQDEVAMLVPNGTES